MEKVGCFSALFLRRNKKKNKASSTAREKTEQTIKPAEADDLKSASSTVGVPNVNRNFMTNCKVMSHESPVGVEAAETAYEGEDEHEENLIKNNVSDFEEENNSIKRNLSDTDLQVPKSSEDETEFYPSNKMDCPHQVDETKVSLHLKHQIEEDASKELDTIKSGHVSDPGIWKAEIWALPMLKRSCSNLETSNVLRTIANGLPPSNSQSFEELQELAEKVKKDFAPGSPLSVMTHGSADKVMLKKHSSSQILPSRSRRLWWKLFLWSHRNLNQSWSIKRRQPHIRVSNRQGGYSSDTLEPSRPIELSKPESPGSFTGESLKRNCSNSHDMRSWDGFQNAGSGLWPQNQWVAFPGESSYSRVDEWVKDLETLPPPPLDDDDNNEKHIVFPPSPERAKSPAISTTHLYRYPDNTLSEAIMHANSVIQSLNSSSTVAHMAGIGLKVIPTISSFSSLRSVNLSSNFIAHITPGSLPKGLHTLNLSRNKITTIEGLKDLTRLRVLDLSYNRIARIGQGLSNCALIKELYLAGNKISDVEGLHRLLKLTVLDLSFNKITTTKALGQLVANYNSLLALNLLGNPIQSNISDDQLRKAVCGLLPKLTYLNKQPVKPQRAREVLMDSVAKAALKNSSTGSRRRAVKRGNHGVSYSSGGHRSSSSMGHRGKHRSRSQVDNHLPQRAGSRSAAGVFSGYML